MHIYLFINQLPNRIPNIHSLNISSNLSFNSVLFFFLISSSFSRTCILIRSKLFFQSPSVLVIVASSILSPQHLTPSFFLELQFFTFKFLHVIVLIKLDDFHLIVFVYFKFHFCTLCLHKKLSVFFFSIQ
jgi:hypothetical protein